MCSPAASFHCKPWTPRTLTICCLASAGQPFDDLSAPVPGSQAAAAADADAELQTQLTPADAEAELASKAVEDLIAQTDVSPTQFVEEMVAEDTPVGDEGKAIGGQKKRVRGKRGRRSRAGKGKARRASSAQAAADDVDQNISPAAVPAEAESPRQAAANEAARDGSPLKHDPAEQRTAKSSKARPQGEALVGHATRKHFEGHGWFDGVVEEYIAAGNW